MLFIVINCSFFVGIQGFAPLGDDTAGIASQRPSSDFDTCLSFKLCNAKIVFIFQT